MTTHNFQVEPGLPDHAKVRRLGNDRIPAIGLWTICGAWCVSNFSDGFVPREIVARFGAEGCNALRLADLLVKVHLWVEKEIGGEEGFVFHDWSDTNVTSDRLSRRRNAGARRAREFRARKRAGQEVAEPNDRNALRGRDVTRDVTRYGAVTSPSPPPSPPQTPPLPTPPTGGLGANHLENEGPVEQVGGSGGSPSRKRSADSSSKGTRLPDGWWPNEKLKAWAEENAPNLRGRDPQTGKGLLVVATENFKDWAAGAPGQKGVRKDWEATWRTWIRRVNGESTSRRGPAGVASPPRRSTVDDQVADLDRYKGRQQHQLGK